MATEVEAIYHHGALELKSALPLKEGQIVRVIVLTDEKASVKERVAAMHSAADAWLVEQPSGAVPALPNYPPEEWNRLDAELDEILAEVRQRSGQYTDEEIAADVKEGVRASRKQRRSRPGKRK